MAISVDCGGCGRNYTVRDDAAGRKFKCKDCGAVVEVPAGVVETPPEDEFGGLDGDLESGDADDLPASSTARRRKRRRADPGAAVERINPPAICLIVAAILSLVAIVGLVGFVIVAIAMAPQGGNLPPEELMIQLGINIATCLVAVVCDIVILRGALLMKRLESYSFARTAAILAIVPCCSPCGLFSMPFGIWALVVLNDPDVKASFTS